MVQIEVAPPVTDLYRQVYIRSVCDQIIAPNGTQGSKTVSYRPALLPSPTLPPYLSTLSPLHLAPVEAGNAFATSLSFRLL